MAKKIENIGAACLLALLSILPLAYKLFQDFLHIQIPEADAGLVNIVFVYACLAGLLTWQCGKHLSLASLADKMPKRVKKVFSSVSNGISSFFVTAIFFDSLCQAVNNEQFTSHAFGISVKFFYMALPLCYALLLCLMVRKKKRRIALFIGIAIGLIASMGSVSGIIYYVFGLESVPFVSEAGSWWVSFCKHACLYLVIFFILSAFIGTPLFIVLGGISYIAFSWAGGYVDVLPLETYRILTDKSVASIPLFTAAGYMLARGSAGRRFVAVFKSLFGCFRGGTVVAAVVVLSFFTTFTGVSGVTILALGPLLSMILKGSCYTQERAESLVTSCSALGLMFPPSVAVIMYGTINYFSVDVMELFKGSFLPGCLMALAMIITGFAFDKRPVRPSFSIKEVMSSLKECKWELFMPLFICVAYFSGFFDLFQTAAFALLYTFCLVVFIRHDFTFKEMLSVTAESVPVSGGVLFIMGAASGLSYFMLDADIPGIFTSLITNVVTSKYMFLILMNILLLATGCLMDIYSAILIVSPLLLPVAESFGISAVQAGVIFLMNLSIGFLTPPVGMDLFIASYTFKKPMGAVIRGVIPFLLVQLAVLMLVTYIPCLTTILL